MPCRVDGVAGARVLATAMLKESTSCRGHGLDGLEVLVQGGLAVPVEFKEKAAARLMVARPSASKRKWLFQALSSSWSTGASPGCRGR